jgi:tetratricopeptide (TPR) repeat protein
MQIFPSCTNRTDVLLLIGAIYYQLGSYEQCIAFNDRCILLDPHMAEAHANLANALQQIGNWDMAIIYYKVGPQAAVQSVTVAPPTMFMSMSRG